jgi:four helix bundle protein
MRDAPFSRMTIADDLRERTFGYALRTIKFCRNLPDSWDTREVGKQLLRSGMGAAANYWSACRGRSRREFVSRLGVAADEAAESVLWLMLVLRGGISETIEAKELLAEGREITAILSKSHQTARENRRKSTG